MIYDLRQFSRVKPYAAAFITNVDLNFLEIRLYQRAVAFRTFDFEASGILAVDSGLHLFDNFPFPVAKIFVFEGLAAIFEIY